MDANGGQATGAHAVVGDHSRGPVEDLAIALKLAAEAGQWSLVATLASQIEALTCTSIATPLRLVPGRGKR